MTLYIRSARVEDVEALLEIEAEVFRTDRLSRRAFRHHVRNVSASLLVAEEDGVLLGYTLVFHARRHRAARVYSLAVAQRHGGRGIGRQLLQAAEKSARDLGYERMLLEVRQDNVAALSLYQTSGYGQPRLKPNYYEDGAAALRLTKDFQNRT